MRHKSLPGFGNIHAAINTLLNPGEPGFNITENFALVANETVANPLQFCNLLFTK